MKPIPVAPFLIIMAACGVVIAYAVHQALHWRRATDDHIDLIRRQQREIGALQEQVEWYQQQRPPAPPHARLTTGPRPTAIVLAAVLEARGWLYVPVGGDQYVLVCAPSLVLDVVTAWPDVAVRASATCVIPSSMQPVDDQVPGRPVLLRAENS